MSRPLSVKIEHAPSEYQASYKHVRHDVPRRFRTFLDSDVYQHEGRIIRQSFLRVKLLS